MLVTLDKAIEDKHAWENALLSIVVALGMSKCSPNWRDDCPTPRNAPLPIFVAFANETEDKYLHL